MDWQLADNIPTFGNKLTRAIGRFVARLIGWRLQGEIPNLKKMVVIVGPHTSNWDGFIALTIVVALGIRVQFLAKNTLFFWPLGPFLKMMGGLAVERDSAHGIVEQLAIEFEQQQQLVLGLSPEGTRAKSEKLKSGFIHIARAAQVPVLFIGIDYRCKRLIVSQLFEDMSDEVALMTELANFLQPAMAKNPDLV